MNPSATTEHPSLDILLARIAARPARPRPPRPPLTSILTAKALFDADIDEEEREEGFAALPLVEQSRYVEMRALDRLFPPSSEDEWYA